MSITTPNMHPVDNILQLLFESSSSSSSGAMRTEESPASVHDSDAEQYDFSDDADYAAAAASHPQVPSGSEGRAIMQRLDSAKMEEPGSGVEVVFFKDNVTIHPSQYAFERISGRLRLILQGSDLFLSWIPYKTSTDGVDSSGHGGLSEKDRSMYTIKAVPISDVRSIRRHIPALGWQYIIVVLSSGLAYPPFYFYYGGLREFLATLKQYVYIKRSADDSNVFILNDLQDPLQKSLSSLALPGVVSVANKAPLRDPVGSDSDRVNGVVYDGSTSISDYSVHPKHKSHDPAHDLSIQVLEKFSLVTKFARETTSTLFRDFQNDVFKNHQDIYGRVDSISQSDDVQKPSDAVPVAADPLEEKISLIWGSERKNPLSVEEWNAFLDSEGRIVDSKALRERIFYGGVDPTLRKEVWKFLLGYHEYDSTYVEREYLATIKKEEYKVVKSQWQSISAVQAKRFTKFRERKALIDKDVVRTDRTIIYYEGDDNPNIRKLRDVLLTFSFYNFDLGYCQGMSDLLSPILYVMEDESESFWCFAALMERLGPNFNRDQSGMHAQLLALSKLVELLDNPLHNYFKQADCLNYFFCFRWILIQFKREFEYDEVMRLWEVLWTYYLSEHFHLYMCVAILRRYRKKIMGEEMDFDTLLKFINELSGSVDLDRTIKDAEALCILASDDGAACIPLGTPPSLPIETDMGLYAQDDEVL